MDREDISIMVALALGAALVGVGFTMRGDFNYAMGTFFVVLGLLMISVAGGRMYWRHRLRSRQGAGDHGVQAGTGGSLSLHLREAPRPRERLDDLLRYECVRLISSAEALVGLWPSNPTEGQIAIRDSAPAGVEEANDALQLYGPENLAQAASALRGATARHVHRPGAERPPLATSEYTAAKAEFYRVAKKSLGSGIK